MLESYDSSNNLIEHEIIENNENENNENENDYNDYDDYDDYSNRENVININILLQDLSNIQNIENRVINDISRSSLLEHLLNRDNNIDSSQNSISFLTLFENNINDILQNTIYSNSESPFIQNFINSTFEIDNIKKFKRVTDDEELKKLKIQKFNNNKIYANTECPINLTKFEQDDEIIILPCNHVYSSEVIKKWLNEESNCCPICRFELEYKEIKCEENNNNEENSREMVASDTINNRVNNNEDLIYNDDDENIILQQILLNSFSSNTNDG